jgi:hypothetical protein
MQNRDYGRARRPLVHDPNCSLDDDEPELPPAILKSRAPGILFALVAIAAVAGPIAWKVLRQNDAIQQAQNHPYTALSEPPHPAPPPAIELLPADTSASGAQVTTTGGVVPARSASVVAPSPEPATQANPTVATPTPAVAVAPPPAPAAGSALPITAAPSAGEHASTNAAPHEHAHHHVYRHHSSPPTSPAATQSPPADDDNPYDDPNSASETTASHDLDKSKE